jgi:membrane protease YdiL (CAAX protease family)
MLQKQPLIKQGWLRVFVFLVVYVFLLISSGVVLQLIALATNKENTIPNFYSGILLNFLLSVLLVFVFTKFVNRSSLSTLGLQWKTIARERWIGLITGVFLSCFIATILWLLQLVQWFTDKVDAAGLAIALGLMLIVAIGEELVFRGYLLGNMMQSSSKEAALVFSALVFAILHSLNPNFNLTAFINIFLAGLLLGINYIFTRNLWFGILLHFSWNFFQGSVLGFPVSGLQLSSLLQQNSSGSILLTGGEFGLEASLLTTFAFTAAIFILYSLFSKKYKALPVV